MSMINGILLSGLAYGSLYWFATSCDQINTYWNYYYCMPVGQRPRYCYLNPVLIINGAIVWISLVGFSISLIALTIELTKE